MPASCSNRLHRVGLIGALLLLPLGCGPTATDDGEVEVDSLRDGLFVEQGYVQGRFEMRIASMFDGTSRNSYHVKTPDQVVEIVVDSLEQVPEYDSWVRVEGELDQQGRWVGDELVVIAPPPQPLIDAEPRPPRRVGTVLVFWNQQSLPNGEAAASMYTNDRSTNVYYGENSYGIETLAGKVYGPYEIEDPGGCNANLISNRAEAAMIERGHDPSQFRQMMFHFPNSFPSGQGCGWAGLASVGSPENPARNSWYNSSFGCVVRNQELGHNYGMGHSHAYNCPGVPDGLDHNLYEDCEHIEYGHPYDPMGGGCGHMNVVQKTFMGWLDGCNIVTTTSDGIFNLLPNELPCNGTQALRFRSYDGRYYYLEYRNAMGEFPAGSGVLINVANEVSGFGLPNYVLDEQGDNTNGYLHEGDTFTDPGGAGMFTVLEEHDTHAVIQVTLPDGGDGAPPSCRDGTEPVDDGNAVGSLECSAVPYPGDITPPEVTITSPTNGEVFVEGSDFIIAAEASDDRQVVEVELYLNGEPFDVLTEPPWEWPATNTPAGTYEFGVIARDARSWTPSQAVTIQVEVAAPATTGEDESGEPPSSDTTGEESDDESTGGASATEAADGCGCRNTGGSGGAGFGLMLLALGWMRRRNVA
ncbi:MAG: hypothetical protein K0V04_19725 [Deltaproteobacteria bacterium]|nr:hypothetical protein [Deltaproteobacteria bacterium]